MIEPEELHYDIVIVGGGPAGLSCAIKLGQLNQNRPKKLNICLIEKASEIGAHILSGNILETRSIDMLIPDWRTKDSPVKTAAKKDRFYWLSKKYAWPFPTPPQMYNHGNYIISLSQLCRWLAKEAEKLDITIIPGFAAKEGIYEADGTMKGIITNPVGIKKNGEKGPLYQPGVKIYAKQTVLAEGCFGSLSEETIKRYNLRAHSQPQTYAIGVKEVWQCKPEAYQDGLAVHTLGWPLDNNTYGGSFIYHYNQDRIAIGLVIGLDYKNPYLDAHAELQRFKHHPFINKMLQGGQCLAYGSRALNEGGWQAIPKLSFPGGMLIGCSAGFLNVVKIKGTHTAMASGIAAAEALAKNLDNPQDIYQKSMDTSWVNKELYRVRNIRPGFYQGRLLGLINAAYETITFGLSPWTIANKEDHLQLENAKKHQPIHYPKPDNVISFSKLSSVKLSGTNHTEDQPCHLILLDPSKSIPINYEQYAGVESRYCPANVYEYAEIDGKIKLQINGQNCLHCKTCPIKDPTGNIHWVTPQGGEGPLYTEM